MKKLYIYHLLILFTTLIGNAGISPVLMSPYTTNTTVVVDAYVKTVSSSNTNGLASTNFVLNAISRSNTANLIITTNLINDATNGLARTANLPSVSAGQNITVTTNVNGLNTNYVVSYDLTTSVDPGANINTNNNKVGLNTSLTGLVSVAATSMTAASGFYNQGVTVSDGNLAVETQDGQRRLTSIPGVLASTLYRGSALYSTNLITGNNDHGLTGVIIGSGLSLSNGTLTVISNNPAIITNGFTTLVYTNPANIVYTSYLPALTNGFVKSDLTNGFTTLVYTNPTDVVYTFYLPALTNGFVKETVTNGLATYVYVNTATNGFVKETVTNGLATYVYVNTATNGFVKETVTNGLASQGYVNIITNTLVGKTNGYSIGQRLDGTNLLGDSWQMWVDVNGYLNFYNTIDNGVMRLSTQGLDSLSYLAANNGRAFVIAEPDGTMIPVAIGTNLTIITNVSGFLQLNVSGITNGFTSLAYTNPADVLYTYYLPALTNGFVKQSVTNGLATQTYVTSQGYVTQSVTNGLATYTYVDSRILNITTNVPGVYVTNSDGYMSAQIKSTGEIITTNTIQVAGGILIGKTNIEYSGDGVGNGLLIATHPSSTDGQNITIQTDGGDAYDGEIHLIAPSTSGGNAKITLESPSVEVMGNSFTYNGSSIITNGALNVTFYGTNTSSISSNNNLGDGLRVIGATGAGVSVYPFSILRNSTSETFAGGNYQNLGVLSTNRLNSPASGAQALLQINTFDKAFLRLSSGDSNSIILATDGTGSSISDSLTVSNQFKQGRGVIATGNYASAQGYNTTASGDYSHAEGQYSVASALASHAEGDTTTASGYISHAEGYHTTADGNYSHAEGQYTVANGVSSHAEGYGTAANGWYSHAAGVNSFANYDTSWIWSDGTFFASTSTKQFSVYAGNGIRLFGGKTTFNTTNGTTEISGKSIKLNGSEVATNSVIGITVSGSGITSSITTNAYGQNVTLNVSGGGGGGAGGTNINTSTYWVSTLTNCDPQYITTIAVSNAGTASINGLYTSIGVGYITNINGTYSFPTPGILYTNDQGNYFFVNTEPISWGLQLGGGGPYQYGTSSNNPFDHQWEITASGSSPAPTVYLITSAGSSICTTNTNTVAIENGLLSTTGPITIGGSQALTNVSLIGGSSISIASNAPNEFIISSSASISPGLNINTNGGTINLNKNITDLDRVGITNYLLLTNYDASMFSSVKLPPMGERHAGIVHISTLVGSSGSNNIIDLQIGTQRFAWIDFVKPNCYSNEVVMYGDSSKMKVYFHGGNGSYACYSNSIVVGDGADVDVVFGSCHNCSVGSGPAAAYYGYVKLSMEQCSDVNISLHAGSGCYGYLSLISGTNYDIPSGEFWYFNPDGTYRIANADLTQYVKTNHSGAVNISGALTVQQLNITLPTTTSLSTAKPLVRSGNAIVELDGISINTVSSNNPTIAITPTSGGNTHTVLFQTNSGSAGKIAYWAKDNTIYWSNAPSSSVAGWNTNSDGSATFNQNNGFSTLLGSTNFIRGSNVSVYTSPYAQVIYGKNVKMSNSTNSTLLHATDSSLSNSPNMVVGWVQDLAISNSQGTVILYARKKLDGTGTGSAIVDSDHSMIPYLIGSTISNSPLANIGWAQDSQVYRLRDWSVANLLYTSTMSNNAAMFIGSDYGGTYEDCTRFAMLVTSTSGANYRRLTDGAILLPSAPTPAAYRDMSKFMIGLTSHYGDFQSMNINNLYRSYIGIALDNTDIQNVTNAFIGVVTESGTVPINDIDGDILHGDGSKNYGILDIRPDSSTGRWKLGQLTSSGFNPYIEYGGSSVLIDTNLYVKGNQVIVPTNAPVSGLVYGITNTANDYSYVPVATLTQVTNTVDSMTNGLATQTYVTSQGYVTQTVTNGLVSSAGLSSSNYVTASVTNGLVSSADLSSSNYVTQTYVTSQGYATTNFAQRGSQNLTNWSQISTNLPMGTLYVGEQSTPTAGGVYTINSTSDGRTVASGVVVNSSTNLSVSGKFSATVVTNKVITLTYSSNTNVTVDASLGNKFYLLVTNSTTYFVTPLNLSPMQDISIILRQDGTGSRVISWTNQWVWSGGVVPGNTTNANAMDFYTGMVNPEGTNVGGVLTPNLR